MDHGRSPYVLLEEWRGRTLYESNERNQGPELSRVRSPESGTSRYAALPFCARIHDIEMCVSIRRMDLFAAWAAVNSTRFNSTSAQKGEAWITHHQGWRL